MNPSEPSAADRITVSHLSREACLYIRQSTPGQVLHHTESTRRQYDLRYRAQALGWQDDQIRVIDEDQGKSGAQADERHGFQDLMARIAAGEVGLVLSLEISRLGRNHSDLHRLFSVAAMSDTLILDEGGIHDPNNSNDRLLLGIKSSVYEFELQGIRQRLIGGKQNKARRGELRMQLPVGLVYAPDHQVVLDPDSRVREAITHVFEQFRRTGSAHATQKWLLRNGLQLPGRANTVERELSWSRASYSRVLGLIKNPRYAGCYVWGRTGKKPRSNGGRILLKPENWKVCIPDAHAGYIDWDEYQRNQKQLVANRMLFAPNGFSLRKGTALLQSRVICGRCGNRMKNQYAPPAHPHQAAKILYVCIDGALTNGKRCQVLRGERVDEAVSRFVVDSVNEHNIDLALEVQNQINADFDKADRQRGQQVEAIEYRVDLARRRYCEVDPANRLVAASLENSWNEALRELEDAKTERRQHREHFESQGTAEQVSRLRDLSEDFARAWYASTTGPADRKRLLAQLVEDTTLTRTDYSVLIQLRMRGGRTVELEPVTLNRPGNYTIKTPPKVLAEVRRLITTMPDEAVAEHLNRQGWSSGNGKLYTRMKVVSLRNYYGVPSHLRCRQQALREHGWYTAEELSPLLGVGVRALRARSYRGTWVERTTFTIGPRSFSMYRPKNTGASS